MYRAPEMVDLYSNYPITVKSDIWVSYDIDCLVFHPSLRDILKYFVLIKKEIILVVTVNKRFSCVAQFLSINSQASFV